jgi:hypothetical protein
VRDVQVRAAQPAISDVEANLALFRPADLTAPDRESPGSFVVDRCHDELPAG